MGGGVATYIVARVTFNPEAEWAKWRDWIGADEHGPTIYGEVVEMLAFRQIAWAYFEVLRHASEGATRFGNFHWWIQWNYRRSLGSAIRRQVDAGNEVVSLGRLLDRVWRYPTVLSRARYLEHQTDFELADGWFTDLAGPGDYPSGGLRRAA